MARYIKPRVEGLIGIEEMGAVTQQLAASATELHELALQVQGGAQAAVEANDHRDENVRVLRKIMSDLKMLSLNARIEAARAGSMAEDLLS